MAEKKITKRENFENIKAFLAENGKTEWAEVMAHEIELLDRKKSQGNAKANEKMESAVELVYNALANVGKAVAVSELIAESNLDELANESGVVSTQKVSALLKKLVDSGRVEKYTDKKKTYFRIKAE